MRTRPSFTSADLSRLNDRITASGLSPTELAVWQELLFYGRDLVEPREMAEAAGLLVGSTPITAAAQDIDEAFRRSYSPGARAVPHGVPRR